MLTKSIFESRVSSPAPQRGSKTLEIPPNSRSSEPSTKEISSAKSENSKILLRRSACVTQKKNYGEFNDGVLSRNKNVSSTLSVSKTKPNVSYQPVNISNKNDKKTLPCCKCRPTNGTFCHTTCACLLAEKLCTSCKNRD